MRHLQERAANFILKQGDAPLLSMDPMP